MALCPKCLNSCADNQEYCTECGAPLLTIHQPHNSPQNPPADNTYHGNPSSNNPGHVYSSTDYSSPSYPSPDDSIRGDMNSDNPYNSYSGTSGLPDKKYTFLEAIKLFFKNYFNFRGRATRGEYWYIVLLNVIVVFSLGLFSTLIFGDDPINPMSMISTLYSLATLIPGISLAFRRMHDIGISALSLLWSFLPCIGTIIVLIYLTTTSDGDNEYGPRKVEGMSDTY